jgi:predicted YcjX-like family ATPase
LAACFLPSADYGVSFTEWPDRVRPRKFGGATISTTYFVKINDKKFGPFDAAKLKHLAGAGKVSPDDAVSRDGETSWVKASNVKGLFPEPSNNADAPPEPPNDRQSRLQSLWRAASSATDLGFLTRRRRIAITGLAGTGKTVFLTTLINHLKHHDPSGFHLFDDKTDVEVKQFAEVEMNEGLREFGHSVYAKAMQTGRWPHKTVDVSAYACRFNTDRHWVEHRVEFLDWPGERVADVVMCKRSYADWSDRLVEYWEVSDSNYQRHVAPYLAALQHKALSEKSILAEYRLALGRLVLDNNPLISPSCYLVGRDGNRPGGSSPEQLADRGVVGVNADSQFAPLSNEARRRLPELAGRFTQRYDEYRTQVVDGLFDSLKRCNRLIVLVDIPAILASGPNRLNDNHEMVDELLNRLDASASKAKGIIKGLYNALAPAELMWTGIEKIAFVATKADVVGGQENRDNLLKLLKEMLRDIVSRVEGVEMGFFVASPVNSTQHPADGSFLIGKPMFDEQGMRLPADAPERSYPVSEVPEKWPECWSCGEYSFPDVYPALPKGRFMLPKHIGLDKVFRFVLE